MSVMQLSVFVENRPGHLEQVLEIIAGCQINIITLNIAETADFGVLRMLVSDPARAANALRDRQITCSTTEVLAIEIEDKPGALHKALDTFSKRGLNIEYMYSFNEKRQDKAVMIFRFDDIELAKKALLEEDYNVLKRVDILGG